MVTQLVSVRGRGKSTQIQTQICQAPKARSWPRHLAVSAGSAGVVLDRESHRDSFLVKKTNFKNHRFLYCLKLTLTTAGKAYIKESSYPFSLEQEKKKSNECYFILVHLRINCVRKAGSIFCCQRQVPEAALQCSNTDTLWPSEPSQSPP